MLRTRRRRLVGVLVASGVLATAVFAFAASNTVPATKAGIGSGAISGYTVSNIVYTLAASDPSKIDKVDFVLNAAATTVKVKLVAASSTYTNCTVTGGTNVSCDFSPDQDVLPADQLTVVALG
jgi:hypothetical protein